MTIATLHIAGQKFRVIAEDDFQLLQQQAKLGRAQTSRLGNKPRRKGRTLKQMNAAMSAQWSEVVAKAKQNTKRLTGRESL